jgi:putative ABC transport system permease protein
MRAYGWLLRLYPVSFRNEYGAELLTIFADRRRESTDALSLAWLWLSTIGEVAGNAALVHWDLLRQDLSYTIRTLRRSPAFAIAAAAIVALGVGATTAAFSLTDFVLIRPLPFDEPHRLVTVYERRPGFPKMELSPANYRDFRSVARSFENFGAYRGLSVNLVGIGEPQRLDGGALTFDVLSALRVSPLIGRRFTQDDDRRDAPATVLLSYRLWQSQFGGDPAIVGTTIDLDNQPYTIIGVMPREFSFPDRDALLWTPMRFAPEEFADRNDNYLASIARLQPGVSLDAARAEMDVVAAQFKQRFPKENATTDAGVFAFGNDFSAQTRTMLIALGGAAACVLLIACANLASLLLARAIERRRELAVRSALGAGRERLTRQMLTESLVLAGLGGAAGIALAAVAVPLLSRLVPLTLPTASLPGVDVRVLTFAVAVTFLTGLAFGLAPIARAGRGTDAAGLHEDVRAGGGRRGPLRGALVVSEIALSVVLLVCCGLLLRAFWRVRAIDPGFTTDRVLTVRTVLPAPKYLATPTRTAFYARVLPAVRDLPGVTAAAYTSFVPMGDMRAGIFPVGINGVLIDRRANQVASLRMVTPGFFRALDVPLLRGRDVAESDTSDRRMVVVVSDSFARRYWTGQDPIGRRFNFVGADREVVGVVGNIRVRGFNRESEPQVYMPYQQMTDDFFWYGPKDLVVRTTGDPLALVSSVRAIVHRADAQVPLSDIRTMADVVDGETAPRAVQLHAIETFAALAVLLGAVGIHGLLSYAVSQRRQEIGVRVALGAQRRDIFAMVAGQSATLAAVGITAGVALAYAAGRSMEALLAGVGVADAATFAAAVGLTLAMTAAGTFMPTRRALRVDPITALRAE